MRVIQRQWIILALRLILLVQAVISLLNQDGYLAIISLLVILITFFPLLFERKLDILLPVPLQQLAIGFAFASLFLGEGLGYYARFWWWDIILHGVSGLLFGAVGFWLIYGSRESERAGMLLKPRLVALFALLFALSVGVLWEIFEFTSDSLLGTRMQHPAGDESGLADTMWDLIMNAVGAFLVAYLGWRSAADDKSPLLKSVMAKFIGITRPRRR